MTDFRTNSFACMQSVRHPGPWRLGTDSSVFAGVLSTLPTLAGCSTSRCWVGARSAVFAVCSPFVSCRFVLQLFDMKKFQQNVSRELRRAYPDRRRLECQCLSAVAFVRSEQDLLDCPIWILVINVVAMDMLKSKLPPGTLLKPL